MARRSRVDMSREWYEIFARMPKADRAIALTVLDTIHRTLPDDPGKRKAEPVQIEEQATAKA